MKPKISPNLEWRGYDWYPCKDVESLGEVWMMDVYATGNQVFRNVKIVLKSGDTIDFMFNRETGHLHEVNKGKQIA